MRETAKLLHLDSLEQVVTKGLAWKIHEELAGADQAVEIV
jgi:hypothetical protein